MPNNKKDSKSILKYVTVLLLIVFGASLVLFFVELIDKSVGRFPNEEKDTAVIHNGVKYEPKDNIETFLVIGLDKYEGGHDSESYNNDKQADFLMLFVFDKEQNQCSTIHINRDTVSNINVLGVSGNKIATVTGQIALAHTYGNGKNVSCRNTADSVSDLLCGIRIDHYISFSMDAVAILNDRVGGVEVTVLDDFTGIDDTLVKGEKVTLQSDQALLYVRSRYGLEDSSNLNRMVRQQQYLKSFYEKFRKCSDENEDFIIETSLKVSDYIVSDRSLTQLQSLAKMFSEYEFTGVKDIEGRVEYGEKFVEFYPDKDSVKDVVIQLFYEPQK